MKDMTLDELRESRQITQAHISQALGMTQAAVSKLEFRSDSYLSSIRKYAEALGGRLEVHAVFPDTAVRIRGLDGDGVLDDVRGLLKVPQCQIIPLVDPAKGTFKNVFYPRRLEPEERYLELEKDSGHAIRIPIRRILAVDAPLSAVTFPTVRLQPGVCIRWYPDIGTWRYAE
jgi:transcriptional regulator with XRE-family HTH domain